MMSPMASSSSPPRSAWRRWLNFVYRRPALQTALLLSPSAVWLLVFVAVPTLIVLYFSFMTNGDFGRVVYEFTWRNYERLANPIYARVLWRSLLLAGGTTLICFVMGFTLAYWIAMYGGRWRNLMIFLIIVPSWTSFLIRVYTWFFLLKDSGFVMQTLKNLHLVPQDTTLQLLFNWPSVLIVMVYSYLDFMVLPLYAALARLDRSMLEAASDLGAGPLRRLWLVTLPMVRGGILAGSVLVFVPALGEFLIPDLLGGSKVNMIGNLIENRFLDSRNWPLGSAMSVGLGAIVLALIWIYLRRGGKEGAFERLT